MGLFLFNPEQMLIGKLSKKMYKPFSINDKIIIEKNLKNLLNLQLIFSGYYSEQGEYIAETIAIDKKEKIPYMIGYKKSIKDDFLKRYEEEYNKIMQDKERFKELLIMHSRLDSIKLHDMRCIIIASAFSKKEINKSKQFPIPVDLYTWTMIDNILIFDKIKTEK